MKLSPNRQSWRLGLYLLFHVFYLLRSGETLKIRPKVCSNALGEEGTCMFVWECIKTEGKHLGTCVDGFLFGSCCGHNDTHNSIEFNTSIQHTSITASITEKPYTVAYSSHKPTFRPTIKTTVSTRKPYTTTKKTTISPSNAESAESTPQALISASHPSLQTSLQTAHSPSKPSSAVIAQQPTQLTPSTIAKPFPTASSPIHSQVWPIQSNTPPNVLHTFRPPIFSLFSTYRPPPGSNVFLRPTFRPPIPVRPTSIYQQIYNTRSTTTVTPVNLTNSSTTALPSSAISIIKITTTPTPVMSIESDSSNLVSEVYTKKPLISGKVQCGVPQLLPQTKVVGGKNSAFGAWPWQVSVRRTSFFGFSSTHRCGGAILNSQWIATAGHCVDDLLLTQIRIRVGEYDFASVLEPYPHIERGAKKKVVHPHYNFFTYENDLALVQLDDPIEFQPHVAPICLPPEHIELLGKNGTVTGWGRLSEGGILPSVLQEVKVPIVSNDKCKNMFLTAGRHEYIPEIFMCAGYDEGGRDSCQGDSGGPLQVQGDDGKWFLAGIISWGIGCGEPSLPGVCTRISKFRQWILNNIS